jgi:pilus assembly protein CpaB
MRTKLALLAAIILGFLAAIGVRSYVERKKIEVEGVGKRVGITVARESLNAGDVVREHMLKRLDVDAGAVTDMHILYDQRKSWLGQGLTRKVRANHALMKDHFMPPETWEPPSRKVDRGMRFVTLGTDQIAGVAGLITPGSRVDILGTFRVRGRGPESAGTVVTKLIARNVEVMALDNRTDLRAPVRGGRRGAPQMSGGYSSLTLHVTALEAAILTFAQATGKISFTLRNIQDDYGREVPDITLSEFDALVAEAARLRAQKSKAARTPGPAPPRP